MESNVLLPPEPETPATRLAGFFLREDVNFLMTNRLPRAAVTRLVGRVSRIRSRTFTRLAIRAWRVFADDLRLHEAASQDFESLHDCFVRELKPGVRPVDPRPDIAVSPCDAMVGAVGRIEAGMALQAKGSPYPLADLVPDPELVGRLLGGHYVTLRLKANMYHRFHAPAAGRVRTVHYVSGDTWNVNPIALKRVERLFCKNERAVIPLEGAGIVLVPVAAIAVASIHLHALGRTLTLDWRGPRRLPCDATYEKGDELGYFHAGSTVLVFAEPGLRLHADVVEGRTLRVGQPLLHLPPGAPR